MAVDLHQHCMVIFLNFIQIIDKFSVDHAMQELPRVHKTFRGLSDEEAELEFIKEAQKLQEYGIHFYKVQRRMSHKGGTKVNTSLISTNL